MDECPHPTKWYEKQTVKILTPGGRYKELIFLTELRKREIRRCPERWRIWGFRGTIPAVKHSATGLAEKEKIRIQGAFGNAETS